LANALPTGTREDIDRLQTQLQRVPEEQVEAIVEAIRASPDEALERLHRGAEVVPAADPNPASSPLHRDP